MNTFNKVTFCFFGIVSFLIPLLFFLFGSNFFSATKIFILLLVTIGVFGLWAAKNFLMRGLIVSRFNFELPLSGFFIVVLAGILLLPSPGAYTDAILGKGGIILLSLIFFVGAYHAARAEDVLAATRGLAGTVWVLGILSILSYLNLVNRVAPTWIFSGSEFVRGENACYLAAFFSVAVILFGAQIAMRKKGKVIAALGVAGAGAGLIFLAISLMMPGNQPVFMPFSAGWAIVIEIFKNFRRLILGTSFNQFGIYSSFFRPQELNVDKYIFTNFSEISNGILEILGATGIAGFFLFCVMLIKLGKSVLSSPPSQARVFALPLAAVVLTFFFLPLSPALIFMFFFLLFLTAVELREEKAKGYGSQKLRLIPATDGFLSFQTMQSESASSQLAPLIFCVVAGLTFLVFLWSALYSLIGEVHYFQMARAYAANQGNRAYEEANLAVGASKNRDGFYVALSQINFQLALTLNSQKKLTDKNRQDIAILINQAVAVATRATELNPDRAANFENLGNLYQQIMGAEASAKNLGAAAFIRAVNLDPRNPALRIRFAQFLIAAKEYNNALAQLNQALVLKSDYANAYYNAGLAYRGLNQKDNAENAYNLALKFVKKGSGDEMAIKQEIENLAKIDGEMQEESTESAKLDKESKISEPKEQPKLDNMKKELLDIAPTPGVQGEATGAGKVN